MHKVHVVGPIPTALGGESLPGVLPLLEDLVEALRSMRIVGVEEITNIEVALLETAADLPLLHNKAPQSSSRYDHSYIHLAAETDSLSERNFQLFGRTALGRDIPGYVAAHVAQRLSAAMASAVFASQIADPGRINLDPPLIFHDEDFATTETPISWILGESMEHVEKYSWPQIDRIELKEVIAWLGTIPGYEEGRPKGSIGRAISALSYILSKPPPENSPIDLAWAMIGLEALYARESTGLSRQLVERTELLLGERMEHKKVVSRLYDYRSSMLHGSIDMPLAFARFDFPADWDQFGAETYANWAFASAVLVASLQALVKEKRSTLEFKTVVV